MSGKASPPRRFGMFYRDSHVHPEIRPLLLVVLATLAMAACDKDPGGQVAARVNGEDIVFREVTHPGQVAAGALPAAPSRAALEALDRLIDQELFAQKAQELRIDRDPAVILAIETARHQILADTYIDRSMRAVTPTADEISRFYQDHPILFAQRQIYHFEELIVPVGKEHVEAFRNLAADSQKIDDIVGWLRSRNMPYLRATSIKAAEQLPATVLPRLAAMKNAQIAIFEDGGTLSVVQMVQSQAAPLRLSEAEPRIAKWLLDEKRQAFIQAKARQLRDKAQIDYLGPFAKGNGAQPEPLPPPANNKDIHIIKGLSGVL